MTIPRLAFAMSVAVALLAGTWLATQNYSIAQEPGGPRIRPTRSNPIADILLLPVKLPFGKGSTLEEVVIYLRNETKTNVVLDLAALARLRITPASIVQLELEDVRLKTGLKLLLDQVGLTIKLVHEDNLLIITDHRESEEPIERVLEEIKALHRDLHTLQDEVRQLRDMISVPVEEDPAPKARNPTIIEEIPAGVDRHKTQPKNKSEKSKNARPGV